MEPLDMLSHCLLSKPPYFNRGHGQRECFNHKKKMKEGFSTYLSRDWLDALHLRMERSM